MTQCSHELLSSGAPFDVVAHEPGLGHVADHDVMAAVVFPHLRCRGARLLVVMLAVDERRESFLGVRLHALPYVEHGTTGGVHEDAADAAQLLEVVDGHAERGQDHHVLRGDTAEVEAAFLRHEDLDPHLAQPAVHVRVVDDLPNQVDATIGELATRLIRVFHGAFDPVAEPEFPGQADRDVSDREGVVLGPHPVHQPAAIVGGELVLDLRLEAETLSEIGTWVGCCHAEN